MSLRCFVEFIVEFDMNSNHNPGGLGHVRVLLPSYIGIIISQYKDPYKPISKMECHKGFEHCSVEI